MDDCIASEEVGVLFQVRQLVALLLIISLCDVENDEGFEKTDLFPALGLLAVLVLFRVGLHGSACINDPVPVLTELDLKPCGAILAIGRPEGERVGGEPEDQPVQPGVGPAAEKISRAVLGPRFEPGDLSLRECLNDSLVDLCFHVRCLHAGTPAGCMVATCAYFRSPLIMPLTCASGVTYRTSLISNITALPDRVIHALPTGAASASLITSEIS